MEVIINGKKVSIFNPAPKISYRGVCDLSGKKYRVDYTVTYRYKNSNKEDVGGHLFAEEKLVDLIDGMIFNIALT